MGRHSAPRRGSNVIAFPIKSNPLDIELTLNAAISSEMAVSAVQEPGIAVGYRLDAEGWVYPCEGTQHQLELGKGKVLELYPGCLSPQPYLGWDLFAPQSLEGENRALVVRRQRAIAGLKYRYGQFPEILSVIEELETINERLESGVFDIVAAEAAHHRKYVLVVSAGLPVEYLKLDNASWGIQSVNHMVVAMGYAFQNAGPEAPIQGDMTQERLADFQRLKNSIYSELEKAEKTLLALCAEPARAKQDGLHWLKKSLAWAIQETPKLKRPLGQLYLQWIGFSRVVVQLSQYI